MSETWTEPFELVLLVEGEVTASGFYVEPGATKLPTVLPFPLTDSRGEIVGRVEAVWREGNTIHARGVCEAPVAGLSADVTVMAQVFDTDIRRVSVSEAALRGAAALPPLKVVEP